MRYSILIVDDDEIDRYVLKRLIDKTELDVRIFEKTNGQEALAFFQEYDSQRALYHEDYPPLLCFLDINMPLMNGWEFLSRFSEIRIAKELHAMAVMMFSSSSDVLDHNRTAEFDFVSGYVVKGGIDSCQLKEIITASR